MPSSAVWPVDVALEAAILGDATLADMLAGEKYHGGKPGTEAPYPFISNENTQEVEFPRFQADGQAGSRTLHIWGSTTKKEIMEIYQEAYRVLHRQKLTVEGFGHLLGTLRLVAYTPDQEEGLHHGIMEYEVWTEAEDG